MDIADAIKQWLETLSPRDRVVLVRRFGLHDGNLATLESVGRDFDISRERVRQIERRALDQVPWRNPNDPFHPYVKGASELPKVAKMSDEGVKRLLARLVADAALEPGDDRSTAVSPALSSNSEVVVEMAESNGLSGQASSILKMIADGKSYEQILTMQPRLSYNDIFAAAREALQKPVPTSRDMQSLYLASVREQFPRAYLPWDEDEEESLRGLHEQEVSRAEMARRLQRQPGAITSRLSKLGLT